MSRFGSLVSKSSSPAVSTFQKTAYSAPAATEDTVEFSGTLIQMKVFNDWAIGKFEVGAKTLNVKGNAIAELQEGLDYRLIGRMTDHPKYGASFDVISSAPYVRLDPRAIEKYLVANFKGIGEKTAKKMIKQIMDTGGESALEVFRKQVLDTPWEIDWTTAGREGTYESTDDDAVGFVSRDLATRIGNVNGVNRAVIKQLSMWLYTNRASLPEAEKSGNPVFDAWKILTANPYEPARYVAGYGFKTADAIGSMVGIEKNAPERLRALVHYALEETCNSHGHVFLYGDQLRRAVAAVDVRADVDLAIDFGVQHDLIIVDDSASGPRYYTPKLFETERRVAARLKGLLDSSAAIWNKGKAGKLSHDAIQGAFRIGKKDAAKLSLDPTQIAAIDGMLNDRTRLHVLTGGPGCGKTALVESIVRLAANSRFHFCAPTGKAAKVLTSRIHAMGYSAGTIHSVLKGSESGWRVNKDEPLEGDILVVDESSMPSLELWDAILDAMPDNMHLLIVGDPGQLGSIQAGDVMADILKIPGVNHVHLGEVHRNSGGILDVVDEVRHGVLNITDRGESVSFSHTLGDAHDDFRDVVGAYLDSIGRVGIENTLLLMSRRAGKESEPGWNSTYANAVLRETCNPNATRIPGSKLYVNDRVVILKNMVLPQKDSDPDDEEAGERVVNGDTGTIRGFTESADKKQSGAAWISLKLDDGRIIDYPGEHLNRLEYAYALTVHKAQGSEYQEILGVFTPGQPGFVNRNMLMTGLSRARNKLSVFGNDNELKRIAATLPPKRNSALVELITAEDDDQAETNVSKLSDYRDQTTSCSTGYEVPYKPRPAA